MTSSFPAQLAERLGTRAYGREHRHFSVTGSTNDDVQTWLDEGVAHGALVTADRQQEGRGRMGRSWDSSEAKDLYASVALRIAPGPLGIGALGLVVGLGLIEALEQRFSQLGHWQLKWPNDLLLEQKKIGGILCEARWSQGLALVACGFGLNVGRRSFQDPALAERATSLALAADARGEGLERELRASLLAGLLVSLEGRVESFLADGFSVIADRYRSYCRELGQPVRLSGTGPDGGAPGTVYQAVDLDEDGALLVQRPGSATRWRVQSDDVWLAAPSV